MNTPLLTDEQVAGVMRLALSPGNRSNALESHLRSLTAPEPMTEEQFDMIDRSVNMEHLKTRLNALRAVITESDWAPAIKNQAAILLGDTLAALGDGTEPRGCPTPGACSCVGANPGLPAAPAHPEPMVMTWSDQERRALERYGRACYAAGVASASVPRVEPPIQHHVGPAPVDVWPAPAERVPLTKEQISQEMDAKDAARFRWLDEYCAALDCLADPDNLVRLWSLGGGSHSGRTLCDAVDAAIAAQGTGDKT